MPLGIKTTGTQTATDQGSFPDLAKEGVVDVLVGDGGEEDQGIRGIEIDGGHVGLVVLEDLQDLMGQGHDPFFARLGGSRDETTGVETIDPQGLVDEQFPLLPPDAVPGQCSDFPVA